jgi:hypothetical protein
MAGTGPIVLGLSGATHLNPDVLLAFRGLAATAAKAASGNNDKTGRNEAIPVTLMEPVELPICLMHVGADGEVLAQLDAASPVHAGAGRGVLNQGDPATTIDAAGFYEGTLDPASTVRALSDHALGQLVDALYQHLDSAAPLPFS